MGRNIILAVFAMMFFASTVCLANDRLNLYGYSYERPDVWSIFIGEKTWQSTGDDEWSIAGTTSGGPPNILSELEFLSLDSTVYEIYGGILEGRALGYGFGSMQDGVYRDSDYLSDNRQDIFSLSTGNADGNLYYWNIDYSYRLIAAESEEKFNTTYLDALIGFQEWHEKVRLTNGVQEFGGTLGPFGGLNSTYEFIWKNYRIGLEGGLPIYKGFGLKGSAIFIPYNEYEGKGVWNLRTDLRQDPSFEHKASKGRGVQLEASVAYHIYSALTVDLGYRYWHIKSGKGDDITYFSDGTASITQFNEAVSERQGAFLDINYTF